MQNKLKCSIAKFKLNLAVIDSLYLIKKHVRIFDQLEDDLFATIESDSNIDIFKDLVKMKDILTVMNYEPLDLTNVKTIDNLLTLVDAMHEEISFVEADKYVTLDRTGYGNNLVLECYADIGDIITNIIVLLQPLTNQKELVS